MNENCSLILWSGMLSADLKDTEILILEFCDFSCWLHAILRQYKQGIIFSKGVQKRSISQYPWIRILRLWGTKTYIAVYLESSFVSFKYEFGKAIIG